MTGMEHAAHSDGVDTSSERVHETANRVHVGMEHTIEQAAAVREVAFALGRYHRDEAGYLVQQARAVVQHLAEKGLLAPARLTEEWRAFDPRTGGEARMTDQVQAVMTAHELAMDDSDDGIDSDWIVQCRLVSDWLSVDHAEGDGRAGCAEGDAMNRHNTVVLARDVAMAEAAGYPRHQWCVVTPRNIEIRPRGMPARYAVAVDLTDDELTEMLVHDSVAPAFLSAGNAEVLRVTAEGDGRADQ